ncbi:hypothetical protein B7Z00_03785 [Candidatus Saccharibacteria bacterium 32-50-10]|nr:MAG: hypothetical protein B7Z00_03785 [Candidatus Saccharibacteria bacterium 32-50-10]
MKKLTLNSRGFTIVELLIVIVVIGILAAISIVAYNGVSGSASDSALKSDLVNLAKKAQMYHAESGQYPHRDYFFSSANNVSVSKSAYDVTVYNLYYCTNTARNQFGVAARSRSGQTYTISSASSIQKNSLVPQWQVACGASNCCIITDDINLRLYEIV